MIMRGGNGISAAVIALAFVVSALAGPGAGAQDFGGMGGGMGDIAGIQEFFRHLPPIIKKVTRDPFYPAPGEDVLVKANVMRMKFVDDFEAIDTVYLHYSLDGGDSWEELEMSPGDNDVWWTASIPGQPEGAEVLYYIRAVDTVGNVAVEMPGYAAMADEWYYMSDEEFAEAYPHDYVLTLYEDSDADAGHQIPAYLNLLKMGFGHESGFYHFRMQFENPIETGTVSPFDVKGYFFILFNRSLVLSPEMMRGLQEMQPGKKPDYKEVEKHREEIVDLVESLWVWYHAPLVEMFPIPGLPELNGVDMLHLDIDAPGCPVSEMTSFDDFKNMDERFTACLKFESEGWNYKKNGDYLDLTIDSEFIGPPGDDTIIFLTGNIRIAGSDFSNAEFMPGDISLSEAVTMRGHSYVAGETGDAPAGGDEAGLDDDDILDWEE